MEEFQIPKLFAYSDDNKENTKGDANLNIFQLSPNFFGGILVQFAIYR
jgi:hypothetical protein